MNYTKHAIQCKCFAALYRCSREATIANKWYTIAVVSESAKPCSTEEERENL